MDNRITENEIRYYLNSYISKPALEIAIAELYWLLSGQQSVEDARQNIVDFYIRNKKIYGK